MQVLFTFMQREPHYYGDLLQSMSQADGSGTCDMMTQLMPESGPTVREEILFPFWSKRADG